MAYFRKRGKKWYYTIEVRDESGHRKKVEWVGGLTKAACEKAYRAAMVEVDYTGEYSEPTEITAEEFFHQWLSEYVEANLKQNTIRSYRSIIDNHILPAIGQTRLRRLNGRMLQNFLNEKKDGCSRGTLRAICAVLKKAFSYAVGMTDYLKENPAVSIRVPSYVEAPKETPVFTAKQLHDIFSRFPAGHQFHMAILLAYHTGMRLGECLALSWDDVELDACSISIHCTVVGDKGTCKIQPIPKTGASVRTIPFGQKLQKILRAEKARQAAHRLEYGEHCSSSGLVCSWPDGSMMVSSDFRYFGQFCKKEFGGGSFHSLRHTHATLLMESLSCCVKRSFGYWCPWVMPASSSSCRRTFRFSFSIHRSGMLWNP